MMVVKTTTAGNCAWLLDIAALSTQRLDLLGKLSTVQSVPIDSEALA